MVKMSYFLSLKHFETTFLDGYCKRNPHLWCLNPPSLVVDSFSSHWSSLQVLSLDAFRSHIWTHAPLSSRSPVSLRRTVFWVPLSWIWMVWMVLNGIIRNWGLFSKEDCCFLENGLLWLGISWLHSCGYQWGQHGTRSPTICTSNMICTIALKIEDTDSPFHKPF